MFVTMSLGLPDLFILGLLGVLTLYALSCFVIIPKTGSCIVERLGSFRVCWHKGIHYRAPFVDRLKRTVDFQGKSVWLIPLHEILKTYSWTGLRSRDGISADLSIMVHLQIADPKMYVYGASSPPILIQRLITDFIIRLFASHEWGDFVSDRSLIQTHLLENLQDIVNPWGIRLNRILIKKLVPAELSATPKFH
jgi:regulator of protease activity HflC (stomatin/prohibitin superfamily)